MGKYPTYVEMANAIRAAVSALSGGLPAGGSTGEVLTKASATDYDATWQAAAAAPNGLPVGGTLLQLLAKSSASDYDAAWVNFAPYAATILRTVKDTTQRTSTSNTTLTATALTFTVTSGQMYHLKAFGTFRTAATTTGLALGFSTTVATTYAGWGVQIEQAAAGTDQNYTATATSLATTLVSTGVVAANTDYQWEIEGRFQPSADGTITIGFRSEVSASQVTWQAGAGAILTAIA